MKRLLSALLAILTVFSLVSGCFTVSANAATSGDYTYYVYDGKATLSRVASSLSGNVTIPSKLGGYPVTKIDSYAFAYCSDITSITIPASVTSIEATAFNSCEK